MIAAKGAVQCEKKIDIHIFHVYADNVADSLTLKTERTGVRVVLVCLFFTPVEMEMLLIL